MGIMSIASDALCSTDQGIPPSTWTVAKLLGERPVLMERIQGEQESTMSCGKQLQ